MMRNKLTPLEELRQEKAIARRECAESEERLGKSWTYLSDNAGPLLFQSAMNTVLRQFGFGPKEKSKDTDSDGVVHRGLLGTLMAYYPIVWKIVQPMLLRFVIRKIKSIFSGKKKKKRRD
jgi:hypothetical protein